MNPALVKAIHVTQSEPVERALIAEIRKNLPRQAGYEQLACAEAEFGLSWSSEELSAHIRETLPLHWAYKTALALVGSIPCWPVLAWWLGSPLGVIAAIGIPGTIAILFIAGCIAFKQDNRDRTAVSHLLVEYPHRIPERALLKYQEAKQTGYFSKFQIWEAAYKESPSKDPWLVGEVNGRHIVLAYWE